MLVALTGGTGFLGHYLIDHLIASGHQLRAWCRCDPDAAHLDDRVTWCQGSLGEQHATDALIKGVDAVIHSAVYRTTDNFLGDVDDPLNNFETNVVGSLKLLETAAQAGTGRFVFISSGAVHDRVLDDRPLDETHPLWPRSFYGACKASIETLIHHYGLSGKLNACTLRPTAIYGIAHRAADSKWYDLIRQIADGKDVDVRGGGKEVYVGDVALAAERLLTTTENVAGETFNCCDRMISHHEVATIAKQLSDSVSAITGIRKEAKHKIDTTKIEALGMNFGGTDRLTKTIQTLLALE